MKYKILREINFGPKTENSIFWDNIIPKNAILELIVRDGTEFLKFGNRIFLKESFPDDIFLKVS